MTMEDKRDIEGAGLKDINWETLDDLMNRWLSVAEQADGYEAVGPADIPALTLILRRDADGNLQLMAMALRDLLAAALPSSVVTGRSPNIPVASITMVRDQLQASP